MIYGIIGGDMRIRYLAKILNKEDKCIVFEDDEISTLDSTINVIKKLDEFVTLSNVIISSLPLSRDNINIYAPFISSLISINELISLMHDKIFVCGGISNEYKKLLEDNNNVVIDLLSFDEFAILNSIATSEGVIKEMIDKSDININGSSSLVLGFGKCGFQIARDLKALNSNVTVCARSNLDFARILRCGIKSINYDALHDTKIVEDFDFIINTVPAITLTKEIIKNIKLDAMVIDIASGKGGIEDMEECHKRKFYHLLGLPGKISPYSSAKIMHMIINSEIKRIPIG